MPPTTLNSEEPFYFSFFIHPQQDSSLKSPDDKTGHTATT